jgi:hypothetical protein
MEALAQSSRIFRELEFLNGSDHRLLTAENFEILENYLRFSGTHVKKLSMSIVSSNANYKRGMILRDVLF